MRRAMMDVGIPELVSEMMQMPCSMSQMRAALGLNSAKAKQQRRPSMSDGGSSAGLIDEALIAIAEADPVLGDKTDSVFSVGRKDDYANMLRKWHRCISLGKELGLSAGERGTAGVV